MCSSFYTRPFDSYVMEPVLAILLKYCVHVLSGKENKKYWSNFLEYVAIDLILNIYSTGPGANHYKKSHDSYEKLITRFNLF